MQDARRARQAALPVPWGNEHWPEDRRGSGKDSGGAAAALGGLAGGEGQGFQRKLMPIAAPRGKAHGNYRHGWR